MEYHSVASFLSHTPAKLLGESFSASLTFGIEMVYG